ncbi:GNAT family N-acetyltransferase [Enterococcus sp. DIV0876]|uniref:GNAT family N-acetyltransferase n=1 Tax=Enterococcus sp. DIV0876 TaxID=2774633 RepID=UPI003D300C36
MLNKKIVQTAHDYQTLMDLIQSIWPEVFEPIIGKAQVDYMLAHYQSLEVIKKEIQAGAVYLILEADGQPVGYTAYEETDKQVYLSKLYLDKTTRGKGYASAIFDWYEALAQGKTLHLNVNKYNKQAIAVYEHRGFVKVGQRVADIGDGFVMDDYIFEKRC